MNIFRQILTLLLCILTVSMIYYYTYTLPKHNKLLLERINTQTTQTEKVIKNLETTKTPKRSNQIIRTVVQQKGHDIPISDIRENLPYSDTSIDFYNNEGVKQFNSAAKEYEQKVFDQQYPQQQPFPQTQPLPNQ